MKTSLQIDGANCPTCFNETLDDLAHIDGVRTVHGSLAGPCIEIDHDDVALNVIAGAIRNRLHGVEMFSNEIRMVPLDPVTISTCAHRQPTVPDSTAPSRGAPRDHINPSMALGVIVTLHPSVAAELERRGLDYCCHGARSLAAASADAGLDPQLVAHELSNACGLDEPPVAWSTLDPADLVDHIQSVHHAYLWAELPRVDALVDRIVAVHADRHPELVAVRELYTRLRADLEPHLIREEQVLFPWIRELGGTAGRLRPDVAQLLEQLAAEHETVGELLGELRGVTAGYATPVDGCATYAACYRALAELEADTHLHVHKESNVLIPALRTQPPETHVGSANPPRPTT